MMNEDELFEKYRNYAVVNLSNIRHNYKQIRSHYRNVKIMTVMKGDAYGHGIKAILPVCDRETDWYAVATVEEGLCIRDCGSVKPVLLLGPVPSGQVVPAAEKKLTFTVSSPDYAKRISDRLNAAGLEADCQIKIDTGLNRTGFRYRRETASDFLEQVKAVYSMSALHVTGVYTHFACGEATDPQGLAFTALQYSRYQDALALLKKEGLTTGLNHCCSTGGSMVHPDYRMDMVRLGMMVYGQSIDNASIREYGLRPAMSWHSFIAQIHNVKAGESVSYNCLFKAEKDMRVGIVTTGYGDGYMAPYSTKVRVIINDRYAAVLGRVCMDYIIVDITDIEDVQVGTKVTLLGNSPSCCVSAMDLAGTCGSTCAEVTHSIDARVPKFYIQD